jgi:hypothetical protein
MKIRRLFENITDPDEMFEIFKDIVDDVLLVEFDDDRDFNPMKGLIYISNDSIDVSLVGSKYDEYNEYTQSDNWGYSFIMKDDRVNKHRIQQRISNIFKTKTGVELGFIDIGYPFYDVDDPFIRLLYTKKEWISIIKSVKDFEETADDIYEDDRIVDIYGDIDIIGNFYYHKMQNRSFSYIFEVADGMGLKINLNRKEYLDELCENDNIVYDVSFNPVCYYGGTWMVLTEGMDKIEITEKKHLKKLGKYIDIDEILKYRIIHASTKLNKDISTFSIDPNYSCENNVKAYIDMLVGKVFPLICSDDSNLIEKVEDQISKLENQDNINIDSKIFKKYMNGKEKCIVWICESDYKNSHYIFKMTLVGNKITIHSNKDENIDGPKVLDCPIEELSDSIFLCLSDGKLIPQ